MAASSKPFGRYEWIAPLGTGGMGEVWLARTRGPAQVQKTVVLKRLRAERMNDDAARARFADEARVAVSLAHPHIVPVFEFGELEGTYYLAMEWVRGGELRRIAGPDKPPLGWAAVALLGSELCDALAYVHSRHDRRGARLVHGDVTPSNVLLSRDGHALIADFGLARFAARGHAGTRRYLAPEQARGEESDARTDLYALALVLCEAATGRAAYDPDPERAERQARVGLAPGLDGCAPGLATILRRALSPARDSRFADAASQRAAFDALLDEEPGARAAGRSELVGRIRARQAEEDRPPSTVQGGSTLATRQATTHWSPRRSGLRAAPVLIGLLLVAGGWWRFSRSRAPITVGNSAAHSAVSPPAVPPIAAAPTPPRSDPPSPRSSHPPASPTVRPPAHVAPAHLSLNAVPWAHVRIDGVDRGETPLVNLALPAGTHRIELANEPLGARRLLELHLAAGATVERVEDLNRPVP